ncbi:MAG: glucose 1-dehydrogenase [Edaphobacter sp.]|uniref:glucose 1-dehydrogenase n=1 Tax=Edaphobacter sp. TaxID=1934404 RepID=UPI002382A39F|nr:glucose 1-dehydrogenase [Edaphobacter sp.]MDE1176843.1 glucose 1-dehydrogenase [Edaphobacter sp.]
MRLKGKKALITGGNSGIGLATAKLFVEEGAEVVITGRNQKTIDEALQLLGPKAHGIAVEITDSAARKAAFKEAAEKFGKLDVLFVNAGIPGNTPAGAASEELFRSIIDINLTSAYFTVEDALPYLNEGASIIFNGSVIGTLGLPGYSAYAATKAGVRAFARVLASELSPRGIRVNVVAPGGTKTPIWNRDGSRTEEQVSGLEKWISGTVPLGRMGEPEEIAKAVLFLASDDASYVQGVELFVDGGATASPLGGPMFRQ